MDEKLLKQHIIKDPPNKAALQFLGMVNVYPKNATFATQNPDEVIVMAVRRHLFKNISWMFSGVVAFLVPTIGGLAIGYIDHNFNQDILLTSSVVQAISGSLIFVMILFYYSFIVTYCYFKYIHWFYDIFIITNERYVSIDFDILKGKTIIDVPLTDIVDISEKILGFLPSMIGYGNIEFKTLSKNIVILEDIPEPTWFRDSLADLIKYMRSQVEAEAELADQISGHAGHPTHLGRKHDAVRIKTVVSEPIKNIKDLEP